MQWHVYISQAIYFIVLIAIGFYFYRRSAHADDYFLGGRTLGKWVGAISAQASDMSGWLLMGLPGAVYMQGMPAIWIAIGLFAGTLANWTFVAQRLRVYTMRLDALTLSIFFEKRFKDDIGLLRKTSAIITLFFFSIYVSSGFVASGKLFQEVFGIEYTTAVLVGSSVIVLYTFLGGFLAVSWTDLVQGMIMVSGIIITVWVSLCDVLKGGGMSPAVVSSGTTVGVQEHANVSLLAIMSSLAWGLGYFGQPHILVRFMAIDTMRSVISARRIAMWWLLFSLAGSIAIGFIGLLRFPGLSGGSEEKVFLFLVQKYFHPLVGGFLLSALLSAIMSTIDSQLLVCASNVTEDLYANIAGKSMSDKAQVLMGRVSVLIISLIALYLAMDPTRTVLGVVAYAWGGLGAAFGPVVLFALFSEKTTSVSAGAGMIVGTIVLVLWKHMGYESVLYEIVPGFIANAVTIACCNVIKPQHDDEILETFRSVTYEIQSS